MTQITKGDVIWRFTPGYDNFITKAMFLTLPLVTQEHVKFFCAKLKTGLYCTTFDNDRFVNHSSVPNIEYDSLNLIGKALRDIEVGEELLEDYHKTHTGELW